VKKYSTKSSKENNMAKTKTETLEQVEAQPVPLWGIDDIPRLAESNDQLAAKVSSLLTINEQLVGRIESLEAQVTLIDPERAKMPLEITRNLNLADVYTAAIQGALFSSFLANPMFLDDKKYQVRRINEIYDLADKMVEVLCDRHGTKGKVKTE
jgi:hypothetical protein